MQGQRQFPNIDLHNHWIPQKYIELAKNGDIPTIASYAENERGEFLEFPSTVEGRKNFIPLMKQYCDWNVRFSDMEQMELDIVALSFVPFTFHCRGEASVVADLHRVINDEAAKKVKENPDKLKGLGNVPLQDVKKAVEELQRVMGMGFSGVQIPSNIDGKYLGEPEFFPFFEAAKELNALILIHPTDVAAEDRLAPYYLRNLIGNPLDTTITVASLIFGEVMERLPGLKISLCHAGGFVPFVFGRWDRGYKERRECKHLKRPPSSYIRDFYYDIITHDKTPLKYLIETLGADRINLGTDYPFDMGQLRPLEALREVIDADSEEYKLICYDNPMRLL